VVIAAVKQDYMQRTYRVLEDASEALQADTGLKLLVEYLREQRIKAMGPPQPSPVPGKKALVIGITIYQVMPLMNPENDARAIAAKLETMNFEVTLCINPDHAMSMLDRMHDWVEGLKSDEIALFYFAGHGYERNSVNYLLSPEVTPTTTLARLAHKAIHLSELMQLVESQEVRFAVLLLDCCRDTGELTRGLRASSRAMQSSDGSHAMVTNSCRVDLPK
jgi:uncharacterized caspase-like protein